MGSTSINLLAAYDRLWRLANCADPRTGLTVRDFKKEDFRLFDNQHEVRIATFDAGARYGTRPITLWLAVICYQGGIVGASADFEDHDTVGVAHWYDNGDTQLDLLPTEDRDTPSAC